MTRMEITVDLSRTPWPDAVAADLGELSWERVGMIPDVRADGQPMIVILLRAANGDTFVATTTYKLFSVAARVFAATPSALAIGEDGGW